MLKLFCSLGIFFTVMAYAEDIDAEIVSDLDFFSQMDVVESMDLVGDSTFDELVAEKGEENEND